MAVRDEAVTTGSADRQGDLRKRNAAGQTQANGAYATQEVKEKSKEKVWMDTPCGICTLGGVGMVLSRGMRIADDSLFL